MIKKELLIFKKYRNDWNCKKNRKLSHGYSWGMIKTGSEERKVIGIGGSRE